MKILIVHNYYGSEAPSGENIVVEKEKELLIERGHKVNLYSKKSDTVRGKGLFTHILLALSLPFNIRSYFEFKKIIKEICPDVVHVHNTFPLISPSIFLALKKIPTVMTLHNYRLFCPKALPYRDGNVCTKCIDKKSVIPALIHRCYRNSFFATIPLAVKIVLGRFFRFWLSNVNIFIALTEFQKLQIIKGGIPDKQVIVKPNFYSNNGSYLPFDARVNDVIFIGRIKDEKGIRDLIKAWILWGKDAPELLIVGDGTDLNELKKMCLGNEKIKFLGRLKPEQIVFYLNQSKLLILPSVWFEGFPMTLIEAFAYGVPVAVSNIGSLPSIVHSAEGVLFEPNNSRSLLKEVREIWSDVNQLEKMSKQSYKTFKSYYSKDQGYQNLIDIYKEVIKL